MVLSPSGDCGISGPQKPILTWKHKNPGGPEKEAAWPRARTARGELAETRHCPHFRGSSAGRFLYPPKGPIIRILSPQVFEAKLELPCDRSPCHTWVPVLPNCPFLGMPQKRRDSQGADLLLDKYIPGLDSVASMCLPNHSRHGGGGREASRPPQPPSSG